MERLVGFRGHADLGRTSEQFARCAPAAVGEVEKPAESQQQRTNFFRVHVWSPAWIGKTPCGAHQPVQGTDGDLLGRAEAAAHTARMASSSPRPFGQAGLGLFAKYQ